MRPPRLSWGALERARKVFQAAAVAFVVAVPLLNWLGVHWILGTLYSISVGELDIADPAMALQVALLTRSIYLPLLVAALLPVALALLFGRVFCSWICPHNTLLDWADTVHRRLARSRWLRRHRRPAGANPPSKAYWATYATLLVVAVATGVPLLAWLSPPGVLSSQVSQAVLGMGVGGELALVAGLLAVEAWIARRVWCKYACPVGATLSLLRMPRTLRVVHDPSRCACPAGAEPCHVACPLGLVPRQADTLPPFCYNCGSCVAACEKTRRGALRLAFGPAHGPHPNTPAATEAASHER